MHRSFQKNKFHDHTIRILENRRVGTGGKNIWFPPPWSSATILNQEVPLRRKKFRDHTMLRTHPKPPNVQT